MTSRNAYCEKFQRLLRELFQFDCADLDFGIYRIMNYKRGMLDPVLVAVRVDERRHVSGRRSSSA